MQSAPLHDSEKRLVEPGGVTLSGTCEKPPPIERLPQMIRFNGIVPARSRNVLPQRPLPAVDVKSNAVTPPLVVLVVLVVGVTVVDVLDVVARSDVDVELVVGMIDVELVVGMIDVELVVGMIDVELVVGMLDVELVAGMIDDVLVVGMIDVELVVGTMLVDDEDVDGVPTHGFGSHEPGPMSVPSASAHEAGDMIVQVKAPSGEPEARQHRVWGRALVEVLLVVGVVVVLLVVGIVDELLVVGIVDELLVVGIVELLLVVAGVDDVVVLAGHGSGVHEFAPLLKPPSAAHSAGPSSTQTKAPPGVPGKPPSTELGTQHAIEPGCVVPVVLVVDVVVVLVVGGVTHTSFTSVTLSVLTELAKNWPRRWAPTVISSFALGAQRIAATSALREMRTRVPFAKICTWHGLTADVSGPTLLPLSNLIEPTTRIVTGPRASSWALRCKVKLQNVYVPAVRTSVPGP